MLLLSRARAMSEACAGALRLVDSTRGEMLTNEVASRTPPAQRTQLERSLAELRPALTRCADEFGTRVEQGPAKVRDAGSASAVAAVAASHKFELAAESYLGTLGVKIRPYGAGPNPFAGRADQR